MTTRHPIRRVTRRRTRSAVRYHTRLLPRASRRHHFKDLSAALAAYARALRSRRRLMKLAPTFFDAAVVRRWQREREECLARQRVCEPLLNKVYGITATTFTPDTRWDPVIPKSSRTQRAVERELIQCELWMNLSHHHLARFQQSRPHAVLNLRQLARLLEMKIKWHSIHHQPLQGDVRAFGRRDGSDTGRRPPTRKFGARPECRGLPYRLM